jgi:methyltransferase (TIGR00027 family)
MIPGKESQTAIMVCQARALADGRTVGAFSDPVAIQLLPEEARVLVERARAGLPPRDAQERGRRAFLAGRSQMMVARTVEIDVALRESSAPQVVILGAGLDGRAWRMPELRDRTVFEVDHPDSQREKRARTATLPLAAREIHFVAVDFTRDSLEDALERAGHDRRRPTIWIWEGVVMYLTREAVEATLRMIERRSSPGSRLVVAYVAWSMLLPVVAIVLRRAGEPVRSTYSARAMARLLRAHGFAVVSDRNAAEIGARLGRELVSGTRRIKHLRVVVADRA